jgi:cell division protein FtsB
MVSVKKQLKKLAKRQDELERAIRDLKPKRLRKLVRRLSRRGPGSRAPSLLRRRTSP